MLRSVATLASVAILFVAGCDADADEQVTGSTAENVAAATTASTAPATSNDTGEQRYPDVLDVEATEADDGTWTFAVTISSPYDTPERYADGWRVVGPDGEVYGEHTLMHDHAGEQPFTRTQRGVEIPPEVGEVTIEGRDQEYGYGGATATITLAR